MQLQQQVDYVSLFFTKKGKTNGSEARCCKSALEQFRGQEPSEKSNAILMVI
jgi:hypothetical protein